MRKKRKKIRKQKKQKYASASYATDASGPWARKRNDRICLAPSLHRYQLMLGKQEAHVCEQLAQGYHVKRGELDEIANVKELAAKCVFISSKICDCR